MNSGVWLVEAEHYFDRSRNGRGLAVRTHSRPEAPSANRFNCFFIEAHAQAFGDADVGRASIRGNHGHQQDGALIFCLYRIIRKLWIRAIEASRNAVSACAGTRITATGAP